MPKETIRHKGETFHFTHQYYGYSPIYESWKRMLLLDNGKVWKVWDKEKRDYGTPQK